MRKLLYPILVWVITCIAGPLLYIPLQLLMAGSGYNWDEDLFTLYPYTIPISFACSLPGFAIFLVTYWLVRKKEFSTFMTKLILTIVNTIHILVTTTLAFGGEQEMIVFALSLFLVSESAIVALRIRKKN